MHHGLQCNQHEVNDLGFAIFVFHVYMLLIGGKVYFYIHILHLEKATQLYADDHYWSSITCKYFFSSRFSRSVAGGRS